MGFLELMGRGWCEARDLHEKSRAKAGQSNSRHGDAYAGDGPDPAAAGDATLGDELIAAEQKIMSLIAERDALSAAIEAEKARASLFGRILLLPTVKEYLANTFHADHHPEALPEKSLTTTG